MTSTMSASWSCGKAPGSHKWRVLGGVCLITTGHRRIPQDTNYRTITSQGTAGHI